MKIGFISDTHGDYDQTLKALEVLKDCDKVYHLGDVLYHGPRNDLPKGYNPKKLAEVLKGLDYITYIKGNCDSDVDEMVMENGEIIERGDHDDLMKQRGRYYALNTGQIELK